MTGFDNAVALIRAVIWPLTILGIVIVYRRQIPQLATAIANRVSGVGLGPFSLTLAVAVEPSPDLWQILDSFKEPGHPDLTPSFSYTLTQAVTQANTKVDSIRFDLRTGHAWLTSRLYIFAKLLPDVLGLRCIVFTETKNGIPNSFVGIADPRAVAEALAERFDWLDSVYAAACSTFSAYSMEPAEQENFITTARDPKIADVNLIEQLAALAEQFRQAAKPGDVAYRYLNDHRIRRQRYMENHVEHLRYFDPVDLGSYPAPELTDDWVQLGVDESGTYEEHAQWISNGGELAVLLGPVLTTPYVVETPGMTRRILARSAILRDGPFVAVTDESGRFSRLLDRLAMAERVADEAAQRDADSH